MLYLTGLVDLEVLEIAEKGGNSGRVSTIYYLLCAISVGYGGYGLLQPDTFYV